MARKSDVGLACVGHSAHGTTNWERRFYLEDLPPEWETIGPPSKHTFGAHNSASFAAHGREMLKQIRENEAG